MPLEPPNIDSRTYSDIVQQTEMLAEHFTEGKWRPKKGGRDAGQALIGIFAHFCEIIIDRLNQVPRKNFLTFLDLIGTRIRPPRPARVALTFLPTAGAPPDVLVPAGTEVAAQPLEGEEEEIVFETESDLLLTTAELKAVVVYDPDQDRYSDRTLEATGEKDYSYPAFEADEPIEHHLYLACEELFTLPGDKNVTVTIYWQEPLGAALPLIWAVWDGQNWLKLNVADATKKDDEQSEINLKLPDKTTRSTIDGQEAVWLRVTTSGLDKHGKLPSIKIITAQLAGDRELIPDHCFYNTTPIDLTDSFYPFGELPGFNDTLYLACGEAFTGGNAVTLEVEMGDGRPVKTDGGARVVWEAWDGNGWRKLEVQPNNTSMPSSTNFNKNGTVSFRLPEKMNPGTVNGEINCWIRARLIEGDYGTESVPASLAGMSTLAEEVSEGSKSLKLKSVRGLMPGDKVRIALGSESNEDRILESVDTTNNALTINKPLEKKYPEGTGLWLLPDQACEPPYLKPFRLSYENKKKRPLSACRAYNYLTYVSPLTTLGKTAVSNQKIVDVIDIKGFADGDYLTIDPGGPAPEQHRIKVVDPEAKSVTLEENLTNTHPQGTRIMRTFRPFDHSSEDNPALYLGFDRPFSNRAVTLYVQVEPPSPQDVTMAKGTSAKEQTSPEVVWEFTAGSADWTPLDVQDETDALIESGTIRFIGPPDFADRIEFGKPCCWLRARWVKGEFRLAPRLRRLLTNTIWASQVTTREGEVLGSGTGDPDQRFQSTLAPVLPGQQVEVREREFPSFRQIAMLEKQVGPKALTITRDEAGQPLELWVQWQEVRDFHDSRAYDRHYVIDHLSGEVRFGGGQQGFAPPVGQNNIRLARYRTGGGKRGNRSAQTITQLKTALPYVASVTNYEAAGGGANQERMEQAEKRGPKTLRHRGRAVTAQDIEDLAYEASPDVARVFVISAKPKFNSLDPKEWIDPEKPSTHDSGDISPGGDSFSVKIFIVPYGSELQPTPGLRLIDQVKTYVKDRCDPTMDVLVLGPAWRGVSVETEIVPVSLEAGDAVRSTVVEKLECFLHPLTGGPGGQGWEFNRRLWESEIYALIESLEGIDHVHSLAVKHEDWEDSRDPSPFLVYSGTHTITLKNP
jgi:hypothetical protein